MAKKILIIEDEIHVSNYLQDIFEDNGYDTVAAPDGEKGFKLAKEEKPDLITLDLQMPQEHGTKFYQRSRKDDDIKDIPVIVITGQAAPHRSLKPNRTVAIVQKPFEPDRLIELVKGAIGEP